MNKEKESDDTEIISDHEVVEKLVLNLVFKACYIMYSHMLTVVI